LVEITAAKVLGRFHYKTTDFDPDGTDETTSYTNVEYIIDDVIDFVNLEAGTSISSMTGTSPNKTVTVTNDQNAVIKMLLPIVLRDTLVSYSKSSSLGPASISESVSQQSVDFLELFQQALNRLRGVSFQRA